MDRRAIAVRGIVQGVGFRPFVHGLATRFGLAGFVKNQTGGVLIEVEGEEGSVEQFLGELTSKPPPLAQIADVRSWSCLPAGARQFSIEPSESGASSPSYFCPDIATCDACTVELFDHKDRRYRYPFINCTNCGPRLTIIQSAPYDRERTTMAGFALCAACRAEYENPDDRRYHAEAIACPVCGPRLQALDAQGEPLVTDDPLATGIDLLKCGKIVAVKGLGGFHLVCLAGDAEAVRTLRARKRRDQKPLAVMVRDIASAGAMCAISASERALLSSPRRPIVLLHRLGAASVAPEVAPGNPTLGLMQPYTPLHHLLMEGIGGLPLVFTSGNISDEPIVYRDEDAVTRLCGIADLFLTHDRPIQCRCDDSVTRVVAGAELPLRRSRGYAPAPIDLPVSCPVPTLALGGHLKATFALGRGRLACLSHHLGDLDDYDAYRAAVDAIEQYQALFDFRPELVVHDLHPDYATTRYAQSLDPAIRRLAVQHHHAHVASCMADNGLSEPVIGIAFDGTGFGTDGAIWGGEFFTGGYSGFERVAHFRYVAMPGNEQAIREPWRMAAAYLADARLGFQPLSQRISAPALAGVGRMIEGGIQCPLTSSAGRLFDAVAALVGLRDLSTFEGQAAMELEWAACSAVSTECAPYGFLIEESGSGPLRIDLRPMIAEIVAGLAHRHDTAVVARRFHVTLVAVVVHVCRRLRQQTGLEAVVLSGGVFQNALLLSQAIDALELDGFRVFRHRQVPPGDGGLSLGQLAIASAHALKIAEGAHG